MKIFPKHALSIIIVLAASIYGCIKEEDFDFDNMAANQWNPDLAAPLIHASLSIKDITSMNESGMFSVNSNNLVSLVFNTNIYSSYGYEFFAPVNQSDAQSIQMTAGDSITLYQTGSVSRSISPTIILSFPNNEQIDSMTFREGMLRINLASYVPHDAVLNVTIPTATLNGQVFSKNIPVSASTGLASNAQSIYDMSDYNMGTKKNGMPNLLDIIYTLTFTNSSSSSNTLNCSFEIATSFDSITPASLFGYFGQREFIMPSDSAEIGIFNNFQSGSIYFDDPKMTITLSNSFGMPIDAQINTLSAIQGNGTVTALTGPIPSPLINYPMTLGQTETTSFYFDKTNSNVQTLINSSPSHFIYDLSAGTNDPLPTYNFMSDSSYFKADLRLDLPLKGYASGFIIQDTIDVSLGVMDEISSLGFRLNVINGFPLDVNIQLYLIDDNFTVLDSLLTISQDMLIEAAAIDGNGKVTVPTKRATDEVFEGTRLQNLFNAKKILIKSIIQTADAPTSMIEIYDNYKLDFKLGVRTKLNLEY